MLFVDYFITQKTLRLHSHIMHRLLVRFRPPEVAGRSGFQLQKDQKLTLDYSNLKKLKKSNHGNFKFKNI
jgi:hypothetical protein